MSRFPYSPDRGDIIWLNLDPRVGHEQSGRRPALVLSSRIFYQKTNLAIICPITSKVKGLSFEIPFSAKKITGAVLPFHVRSVDAKTREVSFIEKISSKDLERVLDSVNALLS